MGRFVGTVGAGQTINLTDDVIISNITLTAAAATSTVSLLSNAVQQELLSTVANTSVYVSYPQANSPFEGLRLKAPVTVTVTGASAFVRIEW
jgi:hypothetical protein